MKNILCHLCLIAGSAAIPLLAGDSASMLDGEQVYHDNCTRCHIAIHTFSPRMMATVTHHMQIRAMLTHGEQRAVLEYLLETSTPTEPRKNAVRRNGN